MFENPRILIKNSMPLVYTFVGAAKLGNSHILQGIETEEQLVQCLPDLESTTGAVEVELAGDSVPRKVSVLKPMAPNIAA